MKRFLLACVAALALATPAFANQDTVVGLDSITGAKCVISSSATCKLPVTASVSATVAVAGSTTTVVGSAVTTHGTFQAALASNGSRKGCLLQNTSADTEYVYFGATGSATTSNSFKLSAGQAISCAVGGLGVATDNLAISSAATDGATYVVSSQ